MIFVIDTNKEDIAIQEAQRLNIPVAAIVDTNSDPKGITYVVPGNDDAGRAISLYCDLVGARRRSTAFRALRAIPASISALRGRSDAGRPSGALRRPASRASPVRAALPTTSRSSPACRVRSRRSSTTSASSTTGSLPSSTTTPRTRSAKKSVCRAAPTPGSPRPRSSPKRNKSYAAWPGLPGRRSLPRTTISLSLTAAPSGAARSLQARRTLNDGNDHSSDGQGTPRVDRRGHDGLQGGADRDQRRHAAPRRIGCARRACPRPPRRPAASLPRA